MSEFKLSRRSLDRLEGIDDGLQAVIKMAIKTKSPALRHVTRTHRVSLGWLFALVVRNP